MQEKTHCISVSSMLGKGKKYVENIHVKNHYLLCLCCANQNYSNESYGSVEHNGKTYYDFSFSGAMGGISFVDNGNEITVTLMMYPDVQIVLNRTSETQFTVISSTDLSLIPVGTVFSKN